jgi:hypothetical protein
VLGWPESCKVARAFLWEYSYKRLELAQCLGQLGVILTCCLQSARSHDRSAPRLAAGAAVTLTRAPVYSSRDSPCRIYRVMMMRVLFLSQKEYTGACENGCR